MLGASFLLVGLAEPLTSRPGDLHSPLSLLHMAAIAVLLYLWCRADARARGYVPRNGVAILVAVLPPLGVPIYLFQSRPWRKAALSLLVAVGLLIGFTMLGAVGNEVVLQVLGA